MTIVDVNMIEIPKRRQLIQYNEFVSKLQANETLLKSFERDFEICLDEIVDRFSYSQIINEKNEIIGFIEEEFSHWTPYIYQEGIFEKAAYKSKAKYKPEIINILPADYLKTLKAIPADTLEEHHFKGYPRQKFTRLIVYCPTEELMDSLYIEEMAEIDVDGFYVTGIKGIGTLVLLGFPEPDLPAVALVSSPKLVSPFMDIINGIETTENLFKDYYEKALTQAKTENIQSEYIIDDLNKEKNKLLERNEDLRAKLETEMSKPMLVDGEEDPLIIPVNKILFIVMCILAVLGFIFIISLILGGGSSSNIVSTNSTNTVFSSINNILSIWRM